MAGRCQMSSLVITIIAVLGTASSGKCVETPDCKTINESKVLEEVFTAFRTPVGFENLQSIDLTVIVPWDDYTEFREQLGDFAKGSLSNRGIQMNGSDEVSFGELWVRDIEYLYVPNVVGTNDTDTLLTRMILEMKMMKSVRNLRIVVLILPTEHTGTMVQTAKDCLLRVFSYLDGIGTFNLVLIENTFGITDQFYDASKYRMDLMEVLSSCKNCTRYIVHLRMVRKEELSKNLPGIVYEKTFVKGFGALQWQDTAISERYELLLQKMRCYLTRLKTDILIKLQQQVGNNSKDIEMLNDLYNTEKTFYESLNSDSTWMKPLPNLPTFDQQSDLIKNMFQGITAGTVFNGELFVPAFMPTPPFLGGRTVSLGLPLKTGTPFKNLKTQHPHVDRTNFCTGDVVLLASKKLNFTLVNDSCSFQTLILRASMEFEVDKNISYPGKNLIIHAKKLKSLDDHVIDLSGKDCKGNGLQKSTSGGNITIVIEEYEGKPLKVISNGGNGCNRGRIKIRDSKLVKVQGGVCLPEPDFETAVEELLMTWEGGKKGEVSVSSRIPDVSFSENILVEAEDGTDGELHEIRLYCTEDLHYTYGNESETEETGIQTETAPTTFLNDIMSDREKIHVLAHHVIKGNPDSMEEILQIMELVRKLNSHGRSLAESKDESAKDSFSTDDQTYTCGGDFQVEEIEPKIEGKCYPLVLNITEGYYEVECAINTTLSKETERSEKVLALLKQFGMNMSWCLEVLQEYVSEYFLFVCKVERWDPSGSANMRVSDRLICYNLDGEFFCRYRKYRSDFEKLSNCEVNVMRATLIIRYILESHLGRVQIFLTKDQFDELESVEDPIEGIRVLEEIYSVDHRTMSTENEMYLDRILSPAAESFLKDIHEQFFAALSEKKIGEAEALMRSHGLLQKYLKSNRTSSLLDYLNIIKNSGVGTSSPAGELRNIAATLLRRFEEANGDKFDESKLELELEKLEDREVKARARREDLLLEVLQNLELLAHNRSEFEAGLPHVFNLALEHEFHSKRSPLPDRKVLEEVKYPPDVRYKLETAIDLKERVNQSELLVHYMDKLKGIIKNLDPGAVELLKEQMKKLRLRIASNHVRQEVFPVACILEMEDIGFKDLRELSREDYLKYCDEECPPLYSWTLTDEEVGQLSKGEKIYLFADARYPDEVLDSITSRKFTLKFEPEQKVSVRLDRASFRYDTYDGLVYLSAGKNLTYDGDRKSEEALSPYTVWGVQILEGDLNRDQSIRMDLIGEAELVITGEVPNVEDHYAPGYDSLSGKVD